MNVMERVAEELRGTDPATAEWLLKRCGLPQFLMSFDVRAFDTELRLLFMTTLERVAEGLAESNTTHESVVRSAQLLLRYIAATRDGRPVVGMSDFSGGPLKFRTMSDPAPPGRLYESQ